MRKSVIAFGILFSVMFNTLSANVDPTNKKVRSITTTTNNVAPLSLAIAQNDYETVEKFLDLGSDIEVKDITMGMTPIMYAARYNNVELLELLVSNGANDQEKSKLGLTALEYAVHANANEAASYLEAL